FTVGVGPASPNPIFGCNGELDAILTQAIGADPVTNCVQYTGPTPGATGSGAAAQAPAPAAVPPSVQHNAPGASAAPSASSTRDSLNSLLVPLLSLGNDLVGPSAGGTP
ncbi:MAG TPA: hypothetical protein VGI06_03335, partial [Acidimicrobiales bacterium]